MATNRVKENELIKFQREFAKEPIIINGPWYDSSGPHHFKNDPTKYTWYRIIIPLDGEKKKLLINTYPKYGADWAFDAFCHDLTDGISKSIKIQNKLAASNVGHILSFSQWHYEANGIAYIFLSAKHLVEPAAIQLSADDLTVSRAITIMRQAMVILKDISMLGYCHRNVNPYAIVIDEDTDEIYLSDFLFAGEPEQSTFTLPCVDCSFIAPEVQVGGVGGIGADMYSVALMLYALFTGQSILAPVNTHKSYPSGVPQKIQNLIELGLTGLPENVGSFCDAMDNLQDDCPLEWNMPIVALLHDEPHEDTSPNLNGLFGSNEEPEPDTPPVNNVESEPINTAPAWKRSGVADAPAGDFSQADSSGHSSLPSIHGYDIDALILAAKSYDTSTPFVGADKFEPGPVPDDRAMISIDSGEWHPVPAEMKRMKKEISKTQRWLILFAGVLAALVILLGALVYLLLSGTLYEFFPDTNITTTYYVDSDDATSEAASETGGNEAVTTDGTAAEISDTEGSDTQETDVALAVPTNVLFIVEASGIAMQWDAVDGATGYDLQISDVTSFDSENTQIVESEINLYAITDTGWDSICVRIRAFATNESGEKIQVSDWSDISRVELDG